MERGEREPLMLAFLLGTRQQVRSRKMVCRCPWGAGCRLGRASNPIAPICSRKPHEQTGGTKRKFYEFAGFKTLRVITHTTVQIFSCLAIAVASDAQSMTSLEPVYQRMVKETAKCTEEPLLYLHKTFTLQAPRCSSQPKPAKMYAY